MGCPPCGKYNPKSIHSLNWLLFSIHSSFRAKTPFFSVFPPLVPHNQLLISSGRCRRDSTSLSLLIIKRAYLVITLITLWIYHIFGLKVLQVLVGSESQHRSDSFPDFVVDVAGAGLVTGIAAPVPQLSHRDDKVLEV